MAFNINTRPDNIAMRGFTHLAAYAELSLEFVSVKHSQGIYTDRDCTYASGNPLAFANPHNCSAQNRSLGLKVKQEEVLKVRSWQSLRLFSQESLESHAEWAFFGSSSLGPSLYFTLSEKPVYKTLVTHTIHVLPVNNWLVLYPSSLSLLELLFIVVHKLIKIKK